MKYVDLSVKDYTEELASKSPVPGGGGTSALVGALGISLGNMVGELTVGKKKYAHVEEDIKELIQRGNEIRDKLLTLVDKDPEVFEPLAKAYGIPKDDPSRDTALEEASKNACLVPLEIMRVLAEAINVIYDFKNQGSKLAISDAGCGAALCKAGMEAAALNVYINTKGLKDRAFAEEVNQEVDELLNEFGYLAEVIYDQVQEELM